MTTMKLKQCTMAAPLINSQTFGTLPHYNPEGIQPKTGGTAEICDRLWEKCPLGSGDFIALSERTHFVLSNAL